jgi:hypothetical protein
MSIRLFITPQAIKALDPCTRRWRIYRAAFPGNKPHPLADLLTRPGVGDSRLCEDFQWVLSALEDRSSIAADLRDRLTAAWKASRRLPQGSWLRSHDWMTATSCLHGIDNPTDWKERALRVIEQMEAEQTPC